MLEPFGSHRASPAEMAGSANVDDPVFPSPGPESQAERTELQAALRRVYRLTYRQQVRLLNAVRLYVTDIGGEDELDDQLNERAEGIAGRAAATP